MVVCTRVNTRVPNAYRLILLWYRLEQPSLPLPRYCGGVLLVK